jgi:hypothetical protein
MFFADPQPPHVLLPRDVWSQTWAHDASKWDNLRKREVYQAVGVQAYPVQRLQRLTQPAIRHQAGHVRRICLLLSLSSD